MKLFNKLTIYAAFLGMLWIVSACEEFDYNEEKALDDELVWSEYSYIKRTMASMFEQLPKVQMYVDGAYLAAATDDADHSNEFSNVARFNNGTWDMFNNPDDSWDRNYKGIRLANKFIESADTSTLYNYKANPDTWDVKYGDLQIWRGDARFLRGYFYFELIKRYGGVPIIDKTLGLDDNIDRPRNTFSECVDYIAEQCDSAMKYLPEYINVSKSSNDPDANKNLGHTSDGAALALKARMYLYAASPIYNNGVKVERYYDSCAVAASKIFNINYYTLVGVNYNDLFTPGNGVHIANKDVIFDYREGNSNDMEKNNFPIGFFGGKGYTNPSQNLVDSYEMKDGSAFDWNDPDEAADPYANRDSRLYASILYNGAMMKGREVECFKGGLDGPGQKDYYGTKTGYYLKKGVNTEVDLITDASKSQHFWPYFRYAEVLLNYAEAMNELYGPEADPKGYGKTALEAINEVRNRAGQPNLSAGMTQIDFTDKVRNERRVELAFEGHRYWDVRRWGIAEEKLGATIKGVDVTQVVNGVDVSYTYEVKDVEERVFEPRMNLYPIPYSEYQSTVNIEQTPGW